LAVNRDDRGEAWAMLTVAYMNFNIGLGLGFLALTAVMATAPSASAEKVTPRAPRKGEYGVQFDFTKDGKKMTASLHPKTNLEKDQFKPEFIFGVNKRDRQYRLSGEHGLGHTVTLWAREQKAPVTTLVDKEGFQIISVRPGSNGIAPDVKKAYYLTGLPDGRYYTKRVSRGELARFRQNSPPPHPVAPPPRTDQYFKQTRQ
jgi:hypothetical protein